MTTVELIRYIGLDIGYSILEHELQECASAAMASLYHPLHRQSQCQFIWDSEAYTITGLRVEHIYLDL